MPLQATSGAASYDGFGGGVPFTPTYIEDVFSTWLYTGNNSTQTITNGIDLSTKGGMVWVKDRDATWSHEIFDTARGAPYGLYTNSTSAQVTENDFGSFLTNGFSFDGAGINNGINVNGDRYASWTFRKQPKFFDVVTWTGDGNASKTISHSLGSVPGCIITKSSSGVNNWQTYHRSLGNTQAVQLNLTNAASTNSGFWNNTSPTATDFTVGTVENASGETYVAYLFAHDAGGFGLTGTDNVISCGSYTGNGSSTGPTVTLGYEPQWLMIKRATGGSGNWIMYDNMRGMPMPSVEWADLLANSSAAENAASTTDYSALTATGFQIRNALAGVNNSGDTYIYIAIRRGPMKTPTSGTSVFSPNTYTGNSSTQNITTNFPVDFFLNRNRFSAGLDTTATDRLRGFGTSTPYLFTNSTAAEGSASNAVVAMPNTTLNMGSWSQINFSSESYVGWNFQRAPGFFDVVCYTGTGVNRTVTHNLGVAPELMIVKNRSSAGYGWLTYSATLGATKYLQINSTAAEGTVSTYWNNTAPTSSVFSVGTAGATNASGDTFVAYLFASCPGVSKVGSYTGTGALQTINCGFTGGARFVLIKRTDSTGDWYVYDSARGISSGNDPYLLMNSTAAEVTGTNYVDTTSVGFQVTAAAPAGLNANGGTYIFLAIA